MTTDAVRARTAKLRPSTDAGSIGRADPLTAAFFAMSPANRRPEKRMEPRALADPGAVLPAFVDAAVRAARVAMRELELPKLRIVFLAPISVAPVARRIEAPLRREAFAEPVEWPGVVYLSVMARTPIKTVLHESRHHWQYRNGWYPDPDPCDEPGCTHLSYTLAPADEDRLELDAFRWAALTQLRLGLAEFRSNLPRYGW